MKKYLLYGILLLLLGKVSAQENYFGGAYNYLFAPQWDNAIKTYNFSRPDLTEKQPLFIHGLNVYYGHQFASERRWSHGFVLSYSYFRSYAQNTSYVNVLYQHLLQPGYLIRFHDPAAVTGWYSEFRLSAVTGLLFRNVNGEPFMVDDKRSMAWGVGGEVALKCGYLINTGERGNCSPYISFVYNPCYYSPAMESVINQTLTLTSETWTPMLVGQIGVTIHLYKE